MKKLARIEASSIYRQQFANVFADCICAVHTHQLEFANTSLKESTRVVPVSCDKPQEGLGTITSNMADKREKNYAPFGVLF